MSDIPAPDWASEALQETWASLSGEDQRAIIEDRDNSLLRSAASQLRGTTLDRTEAGGDFTLDGLQDDHRWHAVAFGAPWNGWATPIVTPQTLQNLIDDLAELDGRPVGKILPNGEFLVHDESSGDDYTVTPNERGEYALHVLGWTFLECE